MLLKTMRKRPQIKYKHNYKPKHLLRVLTLQILLFSWAICASNTGSTASLLPSLAADVIEFQAEKVSSTAAKGRERTELEGNVFVDVNNSSIQTEQLEIFGEDRDILVAKGNVFIDNREQKLKIKGQQLFYNRKTKLLRIRRGIDLEDQQNEVIVYCEFLEYDEEADIAKLQANVRIFSEDITARSEYALYNRETEIVELSGAPIVYKGDDVYRAAHIYVNLDTKDVTLDNGVEGQIVTDE